MSLTPRRQQLYSKHPDLTRIHCIGDSIVAGGGVAFDEAQPFCLEEQLNLEYPHNIFICDNIGHDGWNLWNSVLHYQALMAEETNPCDLITLTVSNNDAELLSIFGVDYSKCTDKSKIYKDPLLDSMVGDGLLSLKAFAKSKGAALLVLFYQVFIEFDCKVEDYFVQKCKELDIPFIPLMSKTHNTYQMPLDKQVASKVDYHPNAAYHMLAAKILATEIRKLGLIQERDGNFDVFAGIKDILHNLLSSTSDIQASYLWAYRAAKAKEVCVPRRLADKAARTKAKLDSRQTIGSCTQAWSDWQWDIERNGLAQHYYAALLAVWGVIIELKQSCLHLQETLYALLFAARTKNTSELEAKISCLLNNQTPKTEEDVIGKLSAPLQRLKRYRTKLEETIQNKGDLTTSSTNGVYNQFFGFIRNTLDVVIQTTADCLDEAPALFQNNGALATEATLAYLAKIINTHHTIITRACAHLEAIPIATKKHEPISSIEAAVLVRNDGDCTDKRAHFSISALFLPEVPAHMTVYYTSFLLISSEEEHEYVFRFPYFAAGSIQFTIRPHSKNANDITQKFRIKRIDIKPIYITPPAEEAPHLLLDHSKHDLQHITVNHFSVNKPTNTDAP